MRRRVSTGLALCLPLSLACGPGHAQLALDQAVVDFADPSRRRADITVRNTGDTRLYVAVTPRIVHDPGTDARTTETIANPRKLGLLATPGKLVLAPGQRRTLRLSLLDRPERTDRIYRVRVAPRTGPVTADTSGVNVTVAYNVLVIARPPDATARIRSRRDGTTLVLENTGNSNALLYRGEQCAPGGSPCRDLPAHRLHAGTTWSVALPYTTPATWHVNGPDGLSTRTFPAAD